MMRVLQSTAISVGALATAYGVWLLLDLGWGNTRATLFWLVGGVGLLEKGNGVEVVKGSAAFTGPHTVEVTGGKEKVTLEAPAIVLATGMRALAHVVVDLPLPFGRACGHRGQHGQGCEYCESLFHWPPSKERQKHESACKSTPTLREAMTPTSCPPDPGAS